MPVFALFMAFFNTGSRFPQIARKNMFLMIPVLKAAFELIKGMAYRAKNLNSQLGTQVKMVSIMIKMCANNFHVFIHILWPGMLHLNFIEIVAKKGIIILRVLQSADISCSVN